MDKKPTITLSLEIELAWGYHDLTDSFDYLSPKREKETNRLDELLDICDRFDIPFTFNPVGYLFNDSYDEIAQSPLSEDWLPVPRGSNLQTHPRFYAPDLIENILSRPVNHEIGTHTYTHIDCSKKSNDVLRWELRKIEEVYNRYDIDFPKSFVAPRHTEVDESVLNEFGIKVIRVSKESTQSKFQTYIHYLTRDPIVRRPNSRNNISMTYCSMHPSLTAPYLPVGQRPPHLLYRVIPEQLRFNLHQKYLNQTIDNVVDYGSFTHLWSHLFNLSNEPQWKLTKQFLQELAKLSDNEEVRILTMRELSNTIK